MKQNFVMGMKQEWKSDNSPVTETDLKIHTLVDSSIQRAFPDHAILSEEGEDSTFVPGDSEYVWICDPVDGTHNFSHGIPTATFMLSLVKDGVPILGVIYDPFMDRMFYAEKGKGAFMNGKPIKVSNGPILKKTLIGIGKTKGVKNLFPVMEKLKDHGARMINGLSIGYMGALLAAGEMDATFFGGTDPHDTAAIQILVEEAGGKATDFYGEVSDRYDRDVEGQLASNGVLHEELMRILTEYGK